MKNQQEEMSLYKALAIKILVGILACIIGIKGLTALNDYLNQKVTQEVETKLSQ